MRAKKPRPVPRSPASSTGLSTPAIPWRVAISPRMGVLSPTMDWTWWAARISDFRNRFSRCNCRWEYAFSTRCSTSSAFSGFMM